MPNYYEILKVQPSATLAEIETACESQYNQWRRLVTHHDPAIVNQANQALQVLETIRSTLTEPAKRSVYDAAIGLSDATAGLADPSALFQMASPIMTPPAPTRQSPNTPSPASPPSLWTCPKCGMQNPDQTRHCFSCGTQLVRECPECKQMTSLVATGICGTCGYRYEIAERRVGLKANIETLQAEINSVQSQMAGIRSRPTGARSTWWLIGGGLALCGLSVQNGIVLVIVGVLILFLALRALQSAKDKQSSELTVLSQRLDQQQTQLHGLEQEMRQLEGNKT